MDSERRNDRKRLKMNQSQGAAVFITKNSFLKIELKSAELLEVEVNEELLLKI